MANLTKTEMLRIVEENISRLKDKDFNLYFFVLDTKGNPSSALEYIYQTAYALKEMGYKVSMLHQEKEFIGVGEWLGEKYSELPHLNVDTDNVEITASDFLFIPEIFANVMTQTKKLPCKKVAIVQNYNHITEFMPVSLTYDALGITDAVVTTMAQEKKVNEYFPMVRTHIVSPSIRKVFRPSDEQKKLIINIICKDQSTINQIIKPFYWENPLYKWVSFRDLRGMPQEDFAEALREGAITIWIDDTTNFGYTLLEALRCGSVVLAKLPNHLTDWMMDGDSPTQNVLWFDDIDEAPMLISSLVRTWTRDEIPADIYEFQSKTSSLYTEEQQHKEIEDVYVHGLIERRLAEFEETKKDIANGKIKTKEETK